MESRSLATIAKAGAAPTPQPAKACDTAAAAVSLLRSRRVDWSLRELDALANVLHVDSVHLINHCWDMVADGALGYDRVATRFTTTVMVTP